VRRKPHWTDFDAGPILAGADVPALAGRLFGHMLDVASGRALTRSEELGSRQMAIWKDGVTL